MSMSIKVNAIEFRILNIVFYVGLCLGALFSRLTIKLELYYLI